MHNLTEKQIERQNHMIISLHVEKLLTTKNLTPLHDKSRALIKDTRTILYNKIYTANPITNISLNGEKLKKIH